MEKLSVVIITLNEEKNIQRCLNSVKHVADEIVVVDSLSTDNTEQICQSYGVKFIKHKFDDYVTQKNYANSKASYDYILSLDADEALSEELEKSVLNAKVVFDVDG
ncbi:MAG: glycosyltransferase family 2 protein, partial [SAR202 cluster bacterium]|nr:glycosyltransferase family 2 protein [SAR202 cluster bacterium]